MENRCVIVGGGGHAKVIIETLRADGSYAPFAITDKDPNRKSLCDVPIVGDDSVLGNLVRIGVVHFILGLGSVGRNTNRERAFKSCCDHGFNPINAVHPSAIVSESVNVGRGTAIMSGVIVNADTRIGDNCVVNSGSIIEHDCIVSDHSYISPAARLSGGVNVGRQAFIGIGATIKEGIEIGDSAIVGAGAVVLHDVPPSSVAVGVPAEILDEKT